MEIWAHRGCSLKHPENTIEAFAAALEVDGLTGIELDVQLSKDGVPVVIHDERVDRTTWGVGFVKDFYFTDLQKFDVIPSLEEVLTLLKPRLIEGLKLNIELKNSEIPYEGMEQIVIDMVKSFGVEKSVIYSSFNPNSLKVVKQLDENAEVAVLGYSGLECLNEANFNVHCEAIHPYIKKMDIPKFASDELGMDIRVWTKDPLYPKTESLFSHEHDLKALERKGVTGIFVNNPENYCNKLF